MTPKLEDKIRRILRKEYHNKYDDLTNEYVNSKSEDERKEVITAIRKKIIPEDYLDEGNSNHVENEVFIKKYEENIEYIIKEYALDFLSDSSRKIFAYRKNGFNYEIAHYFDAAELLAKKRVESKDSILKVSKLSLVVGLNHDVLERRAYTTKGGASFFLMSTSSKKKRNEEIARREIDRVSQIWREYELYNPQFRLDRFENMMERVTRYEVEDYRKDIASINEKKLRAPYTIDNLLEQFMPILKTNQAKFADRNVTTRTRKPDIPMSFGFLDVLHTHSHQSPDQSYSSHGMTLKKMKEVQERNIENHLTDKLREVVKFVMPPSFMNKKFYKNTILTSQYNQCTEGLIELIDSLKNGPKKEIVNELILTDSFRDDLLKVSEEEDKFQLDYFVNYLVPVFWTDPKKRLHSAKGIIEETLWYDGLHDGYSHITTESEHPFDGVTIKYFEGILGKKTFELKEMIRQLDSRQGVSKAFELYMHHYHMIQKLKENRFYYPEFLSDGGLEPFDPVNGIGDI